MGLWLVQECRRQWQREGVDLSYPEMTDMAQKAEPFARHIEVDYSGILAPGDMPDRINSYLAETGQKPIDDKGQMIRVILESLALKYRVVMERIEDVTGQPIECLHIVGGGIQNKAAGQIKTLAELRNIVRNTFELKEYQPQEASLWDEQYQKVHKS
jgi:sugar (pentulose or hexulose) kinase